MQIFRCDDSKLLNHEQMSSHHEVCHELTLAPRE
jgi:hypothetical protein